MAGIHRAPPLALLYQLGRGTPISLRTSGCSCLVMLFPLLPCSCASSLLFSSRALGLDSGPSYLGPLSSSLRSSPASETGPGIDASNVNHPSSGGPVTFFGPAFWLPGLGSPPYTLICGSGSKWQGLSMLQWTTFSTLSDGSAQLSYAGHLKHGIPQTKEALLLIE